MISARIFVIALIFVKSSAFSPFKFRFSASYKTIASSYSSQEQYAGKPDLFSDDLFEDDGGKKKSKDDAKDENPVQRKYLEEKWALSSDDEKEFRGLPGMRQNTTTEAKSGNATTKFPAYALLYKFRKEYLDSSVDAFMADHHGHCLKFRRLLSSEVINLGKSKGVVSLFAGFTANDKAETKAEITQFIEEDPLLIQDTVETWDLIDLTTKSGSSVDLNEKEAVSP